MPILSCKALKPQYLSPPHSTQSELWGAELSLDVGEHLLIRGASGRGKTTFFEILMGARRDYEGSLEVCGSNPKTLRGTALARYRQHCFSTVFQGLGLFDELSIAQNLKLTPYPEHDSLLGKDAPELLAELGVTHPMHTQLRYLSMGQKQRIALTRALTHQAPILLLDEPLSYLDPDNIDKASAYIRAYLKTHRSTLILLSLDEDYGLPIQKELTL